MSKPVRSADNILISIVICFCVCKLYGRRFKLPIVFLHQSTFKIVMTLLHVIYTMLLSIIDYKMSYLILSDDKNIEITKF